MAATSEQSIITAELPGVKKEDMQASLNNGVLEIRIPEPAESQHPEPALVPIS